MNPAKYRCSILGAQLADEWITYTRSMARTDGGANLSQAVRSFAKFVDKHLPTLGIDPADARLDGHKVDLVEVFHRWEEDLRQHHGLRSNSPYEKANCLLTLIEQRALKDTSMPEALRVRAQAPPAYPTYKGEPLDEFSNAERIALRDAARNAIRSLEARLARGRELLERGVDPRDDGWHEPARCRNSTITRAHAPYWVAEEDDLTAQSTNPRLSPPRREAVFVRLADVQRITRALEEEGRA